MCDGLHLLNICIRMDILWFLCFGFTKYAWILLIVLLFSLTLFKGDVWSFIEFQGESTVFFVHVFCNYSPYLFFGFFSLAINLSNLFLHTHAEILKTLSDFWLVAGVDKCHCVTASKMTWDLKVLLLFFFNTFFYL